MNDPEHTRPIAPADDDPYRAPAAVAAEPNSRPDLYGVGGWLLLLCVALTILSPLAVIGIDVSAFLQLESAFNRVPGLATYMTIASLLDLGLAAGSVYAGIGLWTIRPKAVGTAQVYLACSAIYALVAPQLLGLLLSERVRSAMAADHGSTSARAILTAIIWIAYLSRSKRVANTYRATQQADRVP